jgi:hypothetical protein
MSKSQNEEEYLDKVADDRKVSLVLGKNLHKARMKAKLPDKRTVTFEWLAKVTTLHHVSIRRFEKGETGMTVANLVRLKDALGCSWDDLLDECESGVVKARKTHLRR